MLEKFIILRRSEKVQEGSGARILMCYHIVDGKKEYTVHLDKGTNILFRLHCFKERIDAYYDFCKICKEYGVKESPRTLICNYCHETYSDRDEENYIAIREDGICKKCWRR